MQAPPRASLSKGSPAGETLCPCGSGRQYAACCQPLHDGQGATSPVQLLRSRFSAYCTGNVDYIVATSHADNSQLKAGASFREDVKATCASITFSKLSVDREESTPAPHVKLVTFTYEVQQSGKRGFGGRAADKRTVTETSVFVLDPPIGGRWLFLDSKDALRDKSILPS